MDNQIKIGDAVIKNEDKTSINEYRQQVQNYFEYYKNRMINIAISIETLKYLFSHKNKLQMFAKFARSFNQAMLYNFVGQTTTSLVAFYSCGDWYSFHNFFNYTKEHFEEIFLEVSTDKKFSVNEQKVISRLDYEKVVEKCILEIKDYMPTIERLKTIRNTFFAHLGNENIDKQICLIDLEKVFKFTGDIINEIMSCYSKSIINFMPIYAGDIQNILYAIERYEKYRDLIIKKEREERNERIRNATNEG